tara:strand:+ start:710 stop:976 length:267 start_codon:yes stop_codon:yes gene_type:complete
MIKYTKAAAITPHNTTDRSIDTKYGTPIDAIYVGVGGDVNLQLSRDSSAVLFKNMIAGTIYPLSATYVLATNTTATNIVTLDSGSKYE